MKKSEKAKRNKSDGTNYDFPYPSEFQKGFSDSAEKNTEASKKSVQNLEEKSFRQVTEFQTYSSVKTDIFCENHPELAGSGCQRTQKYNNMVLDWLS